MASKPLPSDHLFDLVVIGSGPAALAVVSRILESRPAALYTEEEHAHLHWLHRGGDRRSNSADDLRPFLQTKRTGRGHEKVLIDKQGRQPRGKTAAGGCGCDGGMRILVIDKLGGWMANWDRLFSAYEIPHLRSPLFFHIAPWDNDALLAFAERHSRTNEQRWDGQAEGHGHGRGGRAHGKKTTDPARLPDLIEVPGCVGKEISKHKHKQGRKKSYPSCSRRLGPAVNERDRRDYFTPSVGLFRDFVQQDCVLRYGLDNDGKPWPAAESVFKQGQSETQSETEPQRIRLVRGEVSNLAWGTLHIQGWDKIQGFSVDVKDGVQLAAKAVVCAMGPGATPGVPAYLRDTVPCTTPLPVTSGPGWCHSTQLGMQGRLLPPQAMRDRQERGLPTTLVVVGGGLTSAQICDVAIRRGTSHVILLLRGYMKVKPFDVGLQWIGRYANLEKMCFWQEDDPDQRLKTLLHARNGGSISPRYARLMKTYQDQGRLTIMTCTEIVAAQWSPTEQAAVQDDGQWTLDLVTKYMPATKRNGQNTTDEEEEKPVQQESRSTITANYIVSATGAAPRFSQVPFLANIVRSHPVPEYGGLPFVNESLQYGALPLFCTGAFSALQIGPAAFNLEGMRAAADRIAVRLQELALGQDEWQNVEPAQKDCQPDKPQTKHRSVSHYTHFAYEHLPQEVEA